MTLLTDLWSAGPAARAVVVMTVGLVLSFLVGALFRDFMGYFTKRTDTELDDFIVKTLRRPATWTCLVVGLWYAAHLFESPAPIPYLRDGLLFSGLVITWTWAGVRIVTQILDHLMVHHERFNLVTPRTMPFLDVMGRVVVFGGGVYFFFLAWDIDVAGWLAGAGIVGIAVGFAAQDTLGNLIAGMFILADAPYKLGDYLQLETGTRGRVTEIGIRTTRMVTRDDIEIIVPNSTMANSTIINESGGPYVKHRIYTEVGVSYGSDVDQVRRTLLELSKGVDGVSDAPPPTVHFVGFGASSLNFKLLVWVDRPERKARVLDQLNTRIFKRFGQEGIEIPFDQVDLNVKELPP